MKSYHSTIVEKPAITAEAREIGPNLFVPRSAAFGSDRRIAVGFLSWRRDGKDNGPNVYAGNAIFRELIQDDDGTLTTRMVSEMMPTTGPPIQWQITSKSPNVAIDSGRSLILESPDGIAAARINGVPADCTISLRFIPNDNTGEYGVLLRMDERMERGYRLIFIPHQKRMRLERWPEAYNKPGATIYGVDGLDEPTDVVICMKESIIDVCVNNQRTLVERFHERRGSSLGIFTRAGKTRVEGLTISPII